MIESGLIQIDKQVDKCIEILIDSFKFIDGNID